MATEIFDNLSVTKWLANRAGVSPSDLSKAYGNEIIAGIAELPIDIYSTKLGAKFLKLVIGGSLAGLGFLGSRRLGLGNRTKIDMHEIAAHMLNRAADPTLGEVKEMQKDLLNTVNAFSNTEAGMGDAMKTMIMRPQNEIQSDLSDIKRNNERLKQKGIPLPGFATKAVQSRGGQESARGGVEAGMMDALKKSMTEAKFLSGEDEIEIRGGF